MNEPKEVRLAAMIRELTRKSIGTGKRAPELRDQYYASATRYQKAEDDAGPWLQRNAAISIWRSETNSSVSHQSLEEHPTFRVDWLDGATESMKRDQKFGYVVPPADADPAHIDFEHADCPKLPPSRLSIQKIDQSLRYYHFKSRDIQKTVTFLTDLRSWMKAQGIPEDTDLGDWFSSLSDERRRALIRPDIDLGLVAAIIANAKKAS